MENASQISVGIAVGSFILMAMATVIIVLVIVYQSKRAEIVRKLQQKLLFASLDAEKEERARISRDLHDGVSGYLNTTRNYITLLRKKADNEDEEICDEMMNSIEQALASIKDISQKLLPPMLTEMGFFKAVMTMAKDLTQNSAFQLKFVLEGEDHDVNEKVAYELYRIVQESVTNLNKYSMANNVLIKLSVRDEYVCLEILDDGIHFDFKKELRSDPKRHGLKNILARIQLLNGIYSHENLPPKGNKFILTVKNTTYD